MVIAYMKKVQADNGGDAYTFGTTTPAATTADTTKPAAMATTAAGEHAEKH
jgi:hypothetical protein